MDNVFLLDVQMDNIIIMEYVYVQADTHVEKMDVVTLFNVSQDLFQIKILIRVYPDVQVTIFGMTAGKDVFHNVVLAQIMTLILTDAFQFVNKIINGMDLNVFV